MLGRAAHVKKTAVCACKENRAKNTENKTQKINFENGSILSKDFTHGITSHGESNAFVRIEK